MSVLSVVTPVNNAASVMHHALMLGVSAETVEFDTNTYQAFIDIVGDPERALRVMLRSGAIGIDHNDYIPRKADSGRI